MIPDVPWVTAADMGDDGFEISWIVWGIIALGSITELVAKIKAGKTTFILALCSAVLTGAMFLGKPTAKRQAVYLTEQSGPSFKAQLAKAGLLGNPDFIILQWNMVAGIPWERVAKAAVRKAHLENDALLVVDTLSQFAGIQGDGENFTGEALKAMRELQVGASLIGLPILVAHHERKSGGDVSDAGRGSSAMGGAVDTILALRRPKGNPPPNVRVLEGLSRFDGVPPELFIELTNDGYRALGEARDFTKLQVYDYLLANAPDNPDDAMKIDELTENSGFKRTTIQGAVNDLVAQGRLLRIGEGKRNDPRRYYLA